MKKFSGIKRTKIIATIGPAIVGPLETFEQLNDPKNQELVKQAYEKMEAIFRGGVNAIRLNFSHGTRESQGVKLKIARDIAQKLNIPIATILDTKGPEIRVGKLTNDSAKITEGDKVVIHTTEKIVGNSSKFSVADASGKYNMALDLKKDNQVLVDDGKLTLQVTEVDRKAGLVYTIALNSHVIYTNKRINLPGVNYSIPFLSEKDILDLKFGIENKVDIIAASFVNNVKNIQQIRNILKENHASNIQVISKVESTNAIRNIDEIIKKSDGIMIARGDLALEIPYYEIPYWEKYIIKTCRLLGKRCIVATQMLDSLERNFFPTRAEVTDVFYAVERGTDATMLSGESASGLFPVRAVEVMHWIDFQSEQLFDYSRSIQIYFPETALFHSVSGILVWNLALKLAPKRMVIRNSFKADFIVVFTNDKHLLNAFSNIRFPSTIIAVTDDPAIYSGFGISYGIYTYMLNQQAGQKRLVELTAAERNAVAKKAVDHYCSFYHALRNSSYVVFDPTKNKLKTQKV